MTIVLSSQVGRYERETLLDSCALRQLYRFEILVGRVSRSIVSGYWGKYRGNRVSGGDSMAS